MPQDNASTTPLNLAVLTEKLDGLLQSVPQSWPSGASDQNAVPKSLLRKIESTIDRLQAALDHLDPVRPPRNQLQLFAPATIGRLIGRELTAVAKAALKELHVPNHRGTPPETAEFAVPGVMAAITLFQFRLPQQ